MKKVWMVAAATTDTFGMNAQDASVETQAIGVVIDAHALASDRFPWLPVNPSHLLVLEPAQRMFREQAALVRFVLILR